MALVFNNLSHHMSDLLDEGQSRKGWKASEEPEKVEKKEKGDKKAKPAVAASLAAKYVQGSLCYGSWLWDVEIKPGSKRL